MKQSVFELFEKLIEEKFSGEVEVTSSQGHATILLKDGKFIWAHRPVDRAFERFQKLSWLKMPTEDALRNIRLWPQLVNVILAENPDQTARVIQLLKRDRVEVFLRVFFWTNLELQPRPSSVGALDKQFGFYSERPLDRLLIEAKKRMNEWPQMKEKMGSSRRVFVSQVDAKKLKSGQDAIDESLEELSEATAPAFSTDEIEILKLCDGRNAVQDLIRVLPDGEFLIVQRLLRLWERSIIRPKDDEDSVVAAIHEPENLSPRDVFISIVMAFFIFFIFISASRVTEKSQSRGVPVEVLQALEIYRKLEGHYPLTLSELPTAMIQPLFTKGLDYSLLDPNRYELR